MLRSVHAQKQLLVVVSCPGANGGQTIGAPDLWWFQCHSDDVAKWMKMDKMMSFIIFFLFFTFIVVL